MTATVLSDRFRGVNTEVAEEIRSRRQRLGMTIKDLAERAHVDRGGLSALESGKQSPRVSTVGTILRTLDELEREFGIVEDDEPDDSGLVVFEIAGNFGVKVLVKGPVRDRAELEESVMRLISRMQQQAL